MSVSNHRRLDCLLNRLFRRRTKKKNQSSASLAFVKGIHQWPVHQSPHKGQVARKIFPFDDVIMFPFVKGRGLVMGDRINKKLGKWFKRFNHTTLSIVSHQSISPCDNNTELLQKSFDMCKTKIYLNKMISFQYLRRLFMCCMLESK